MILDSGRIAAVNTLPLGDELALDAPVGTGTLTVTDAADFSEDGGVLSLGDVVYTYSAVDDETGVIFLDTTVTVAAFEGDPVLVWDAETEAFSVETIALVIVEGETENDDALEAIVPHSLIAYLPEGIRENGGEYVTVEWRGDDVFIQDILHREPLLEAAYIPEPDIETGNKVHRGDTPPWNDGDATHAEDDGDLWYDTSVITNEDGTTVQTFRPYLWDGVNLVWVDASDPELDLVAAEVGANQQTLDGLISEVENVAETATDARNLASTADGRVSMSDYDPAPEDVSYYVVDDEGNLVFDADGNPILRNRTPGSVWYTRTRARQNLVPNPSFETGTAGWVGSGTRTRVVAETVISGDYAMRIVNPSTAGNHYTGIRPVFPVEPGQTFSASVFGLIESGSGIGARARIYFRDSGGALIPGSVVNGPQADLNPEDWREMRVTATAPDDAVDMAVDFFNPNPSAVWLVDGALVEAAEYTGRYFDGRSYDASWDGDPDNSTSTMEGGKVVTVWELYDNGWVRLDFTATTAYDASASDLTHGTLAPALIADHSLGIEKQATNLMRASEALFAGDLVHMWDNNGLFFVRRASALGYEAHGFVLDDTATGETVHVYTSGYNPMQFDLTPGKQYLSATAGQTSGHAPVKKDRLVQRVGTASDATTLHFNPGPSIKLT